MMTTRMMSVAANNDAELVSESLSGNRDAFGQIVSRYQSLVCSLAYSATGSLSQSEDLAQETFVAAWKQLADLREPHKLRAWLCGIARNLINYSLRRQGREPSHAAEPLETVEEPPSLEPLPPEQAIGREEEAILWRSLERIPEIYRDPLVLFYREHQSIEAVAQDLELSEDAVKQRLSRGRKLLHERVLAFVEGALERTNPDRAFTLGVLAALPAFTISAKAATIGAAAVKGSATAKAAAVTGVFSAILGPVLMVLGNYFGYRLQLDNARTDREREFIRGFYKKLTASMVGFAVAILLGIGWGLRSAKLHPPLFAGLIIGLACAYALVVLLISIWSICERRKLLAGYSEQEIAAASTRPVWEYRSQAEWLGLPLVHFRFGGRVPARTRFVKAWIAAGDGAIGLLFAFGGIAIAPVSFGGVAVGLLPVGGAALGVLVTGGFGLGVWTFGGLAIGWQAFGGCALAWNAAEGGAAIARDFAVGGFAHAVQANNEVAMQFVRSNPFFRLQEAVAPFLMWLNLLWFLPMILWWRAVARRQGRN